MIGIPDTACALPVCLLLRTSSTIADMVAEMFNDCRLGGSADAAADHRKTPHKVSQSHYLCGEMPALPLAKCMNS